MGKEQGLWVVLTFPYLLCSSEVMGTAQTLKVIVDFSFPGQGSPPLHASQWFCRGGQEGAVDFFFFLEFSVSRHSNSKTMTHQLRLRSPVGFSGWGRNTGIFLRLLLWPESCLGGARVRSFIALTLLSNLHLLYRGSGSPVMMIKDPNEQSYSVYPIS